MLDLRTQEGRYARDICDGIAADLGGAPNAAQQILCQMFAPMRHGRAALAAGQLLVHNRALMGEYLAASLHCSSKHCLCA